MADREIVVDDSIANSDWVKANAFDFPSVKSLADFEKRMMVPQEPLAWQTMLASYAGMPWLPVAPRAIRMAIIDAARKQDLEKASFGGDRSAAGRYAAEQRWKGHVKQEPSSGGPRDAIKAEAKRLQKALAESQTIGEANIQTYGFLRDDVVFDGLDTYDSITGLKMVSMGIPQQTSKDGKLRRQSVKWSEDAILNNSFVKIPSPELMRLEKQVNKLGQSALEYADAELKAQGVSEESIAAEKQAVTDERRVAGARVTEIVSAFNYMSEADTTILTPEVKAVADRARNLYSEYVTTARVNIDSVPLAERKAFIEKAEQRQVELKSAVEQLNTFRDSYPELLKYGALEKSLQEKERAVKSYTERRYEVVHNLLRETRTFDAVEPMFSKKEAEDQKIADQLRDEVKRYIPSQLIEMVNKNHGNIKVTTSQGGGSFSRSAKQISTAVDQPYIHLHEYIHAIASATPLGRAMEQALLARRTIGLESNSDKREEFNSAVLKEGRQKVAKSATYTFGKAKYDHIPDKFRDPYTGRLYDHESAEVLTTGHDFIFSDDRIRGAGSTAQIKKLGRTGTDYDLSGTTIGLLFTLGESQ